MTFDKKQKVSSCLFTSRRIEDNFALGCFRIRIDEYDLIVLRQQRFVGLSTKK